MLTPSFKIEQTDEFIIISIKVPFPKESDSDYCYIDGCKFTFCLQPYYLRLSLPGNLIEDNRLKTIYKDGTFTISVPKETPGEHFPDLDMLTKLLAPTGSNTPKLPLIEVIGDGDSVISDEEEEEEFDWLIEQEPFVEDDSGSLLQNPRYGFGNRYSGVLKRLQAELWGVVDLKDADHVLENERRILRQADEDTVFNDEHYLADLHQNEDIERLIAFHPVEIDLKLTEEENAILLKLPRKEYLLDHDEKLRVMLGLVDILFAYMFNYRTTEGENTSESCWTVCKLSASLSWLESSSSLRDVVVTSFRRSLCFPLYRNWRLTEAVFDDVKKILALGRCRILKCLLDVRQLLYSGDDHYILNDLYITDYCVWIQSVSEKSLNSLAEKLNQIKITKADVGFELEILEQAGLLALEDQSRRSSSGSEGSSDDDEEDTGDEDDSSEEEEESSSDEESGKNDESDVSNVDRLIQQISLDS